MNRSTEELGAGLASVDDLVGELASSFELCLQFYAQWRRRREKENHYRRPGIATKKPAAMANCALTTSLAMGGVQIKELFSTGHAILGLAYATGDNAGRRALQAQRDLLRDQVAVLRAAMTSTAGPLDINVILQASETARITALQALAEQYRRMAHGQLGVPREPPLPRWQPLSHEEGGGKSRTRREGGRNHAADLAIMPPPPPPIPTAATIVDDPPPRPGQAPSERWLTYLDDDAMTTAWSVLSGPLVFQSEPPSPPLTPKTPLVPPPPVPPLPPSIAASGRRPSPRVAAAAAEDGPTGKSRRKTAATAMAMAMAAERRRPAADVESAYGGPPSERDGCGVALAAGNGRNGMPSSSARPKNSVFTIFCPEAMALQVDVRRPIPDARKCRCGFRWGPAVSSVSATNTSSGFGTGIVVGTGNSNSNSNGTGNVGGNGNGIGSGNGNSSVNAVANTSAISLSATPNSSSAPSSARDTALLLKDGFSMSRRFLAKSHCEGSAAGFGCVLCTSSGLAQTYDTAELLRVHINETHSKWQMLHDRDMT